MASTSQSAHRTTIRVFSVIFICIGVAIIVRTLASGGGVLALGVIMGLMFIALGAARLAMSKVHTEGSKK